MWSGVSVQVRRQFPRSGPASVPQVVPLGLRAGLRHLPGSGGPESPRRRRRGGYLQERVRGSWTDPPFPRPRQPGFLLLPPGAEARGCWACADKGLAAWPRLIRSGADPGGNRRAGITECAPPGPPQPVTLRRLLPPQAMEDPNPQEPSTKHMQRGKEARLLLLSSEVLALNPTPYADGGGRGPFPVL